MTILIDGNSPAARSVMAMASTAGTAEMYESALTRLQSIIMFDSEDLGITPGDALELIRVIHLLRTDIRDIFRSRDAITPVVEDAEVNKDTK